MIGESDEVTSLSFHFLPPFELDRGYAVHVVLSPHLAGEESLGVVGGKRGNKEVGCRAVGMDLDPHLGEKLKDRH